MSINEYAERNREAWNQVMPIHQRHRKTDLYAAVQAESFSVLDETEAAIFDRLSVPGKAIAQLCCNNGRELISVLKRGAARGVGFDISDAAIAEAKQLGALSNTPCEFVRTNIYDVEQVHFNQFDIVYITIGALCWFDDLDRFFHIVAQLLRENGTLFIYESHPFLNMIPLPGEAPFDAQNELKIAYSYFKPDPFIGTNGLDYIGHTQYEAKPTYSFPHTVSAIFISILNNKLTILDFQEYPHNISENFKFLETYRMMPMCYTLMAQK